VRGTNNIQDVPKRLGQMYTSVKGVEMKKIFPIDVGPEITSD
jgi:hypothetical protein